MEHLFVPYEIAKELKELGFDEPCLAFYHICNTLELKKVYGQEYFLQEKSGNWNSGCIQIKAPLYQQAFRWFRKEHKLHSVIDHVDSTMEYYFDFDIIDQAKRKCSKEEYNTYEEAELACLIKLIEIVKNRE